MTALGGLGRRRLTFDIVVQIIGRTAGLALGVVVTVALVRHLGESGFGKWATMLSVAAMVTAAGASTLPKVVIPKAAAEPERERTWMGAFVALQTFIAPPGMALCLAILLLISRGTDMMIASLIVSFTVLLNLPGALAAVFQIRVRNDISTALSLAQSVIWTGGVLVIIALDGGLVPIALLFAASLVITDLITVGMSVRYMRFDWAAGRALRSTVVRIAVPVALFGLAVSAYNQIDTLIVFEFGGSKDAGLYGAVYRILDQAGVFPAAIVTTITPIVAASHKTNLERVHNLFQAAADSLMIFAFGAVAISVAAGAPLLELLYGHSFASAAPALAILMGAYVLIGLGYVYGSMVVVLGIQRKVLRFALTALAVNITLNLIFVPIFGYVAAAVITVITEALVLSLTVRVVAPMLRFKMQRQAMVRTAFAAASMGLIVWLLREAGVPVGGLIAASLASYLALLFAFRAVRLQELVSLIRDQAQPQPS